MDEGESASSAYIHGSSPEEQERLTLLNDLLNESCLRELNPQPGERVLDVGSGLGQFSRLIARTVDRDGHVVGVERDNDQLTQAKSLAADAGEADLIEFRQGEATQLPLGEAEWGTFDIAHARFLLEHVQSPEAVVAQMVKAVRPGGRVFVSDDDHDDFRPWPEPQGFSPLWQAYVRSYESLGNDPYVGRRLPSLLRDAGLTAVRNTVVFFGGCAGDNRFEAIADNLIGIFEGAKDAMLSAELLSEAAFTDGMDGVRAWKAHPSAVSWYTANCAEGFVPD